MCDKFDNKSKSTKVKLNIKFTQCWSDGNENPYIWMTKMYNLRWKLESIHSYTMSDEDFMVQILASLQRNYAILQHIFYLQLTQKHDTLNIYILREQLYNHYKIMVKTSSNRKSYNILLIDSRKKITDLEKPQFSKSRKQCIKYYREVWMVTQYET